MVYQLSDTLLIAEIPAIATTLLSESPEFEEKRFAHPAVPTWKNFMNGWTPLEKLTRDSIHEQAQLAAKRKEEMEQERARLNALTEKPNFPSRALDSSLRARAMKALEDPIVLRALEEWTQGRKEKSSPRF